MPDYNLGRAHGTIKVDYDGRGVRQADEDLSKLGKTTEDTEHKVTASSQHSQAEMASLAAASKKLQGEVARAAAAEIAAKARLRAAEENLAAVRAASVSGAQRIARAQQEVITAQARVANSSDRLRQSQAALSAVQQKLAGQRNPRVDVEGDPSKLQAMSEHLKNIDKNSHTAVSGLNAFSGRLKAMIAAVSLASPTVAGLGVSLVALTGLAGVAAGGLAALIAVGGTIVTVFGGLGNVFKQAAQQSASAGQSAIQAAQQQRAAARQVEQALIGVRNAYEGLSRAREDAARVAQQTAQTIVGAERAWRDAQTAATRAQETLTKARRDALRGIQDLQSALTGGALDERQAIIDVQRAQDDLNKTLKDPRASKLDRDQAILTLEKQKEALEAVRRSNSRLADDESAASKAGVDGADAVRSANEEVLHTKESLSDAQLSLAQAVVQGARDQTDAQRAIRDAVEAVANAQADLQDANTQAAQAGQSGAAKMADAMAQVSPKARELVTAILGQKQAWQDVKFAVQDAALDGVAKDVAPLAQRWFPLLKTGMAGIAQELNGLIQAIIAFLMQANTTRDVATIFINTRAAVHNLIPAIINLLSVFVNLAAVGSGFLPGLAQKFADVTQRVRELTDQTRQSGAMSDWIQGGIHAAGELWQLLKNLASIIGTIFTAFDQSGGGALQSLVTLTGALADFLKTAQGQEILQQLGKTLAAVAKLFGTVLFGAIHALAPAFVILAPLIQQFADILGKEIFIALTALEPLLTFFAHVIEFLGPVLVPLIATMFLLNKAIGIIAVGFRILTAVMATNPFILITIAIIALTILIITNWDRIKTFLIEAWQLIRDEALAIWDHIKSAIVDPVVTAMELVIATVQRLIDGIRERWNSLIDLTHRAFDLWGSAVVDPIKGTIDRALDFIGALPGKVGDFFKGAGEWLLHAGEDIINGLIRGIGNMAGRLWDRVEGIGRDIGNAFKNILSIFSPSKVFEKFGEFTIQGYIVGLDAMQGTVVQRVIEIAASITNAGTLDALAPPAPAMLLPATVTQAAAAPATIVIQNLNIPVTGNLDPTNPVAWRKAIVSLKEGIRDVERQSR